MSLKSIQLGKKPATGYNSHIVVTERQFYFAQRLMFKDIKNKISRANIFQHSVNELKLIQYGLEN